MNLYIWRKMAMRSQELIFRWEDNSIISIIAIFDVCDNMKLSIF